jgi:hypothetical protein
LSPVGILTKEYVMPITPWFADIAQVAIPITPWFIAAKQSADNPVLFNGEGWYFGDEVQMPVGPYDSLAQATAAYNRYCFQFADNS